MDVAPANEGRPVEDGEVPTEQTDEAARIAELEGEVADWKDRTLRAVAELENYRRRTRNDRDEAARLAAERLIAQLLPVVDNFARALDAAEVGQEQSSLRSGIELIHRQLLEVLEHSGVEKIAALGSQFDPNLHEAILQVPAADGQAAGVVVEEIRAGYRVHDRVIRPSLVKVTAG